MFNGKIPETKSEKLLLPAKFSILRLTSLKILNSGIILKTFTHAFIEGSCPYAGLFCMLFSHHSLDVFKNFLKKLF